MNCSNLFEVLTTLVSLALDLLLLWFVGVEPLLVSLLGIVVESTGQRHMPTSGALARRGVFSLRDREWFLLDYRDFLFYKKKGEEPETPLRRYKVVGIFKYHDEPRTGDVMGTVVWYDPLSSKANVKVKLDEKTATGKDSVRSFRFRDLLYFHALRSFGLIHRCSTIVGLRVFLSSKEDCYMIRRRPDNVLLPDTILRLVNKCRSYSPGSGMKGLGGYWLTPSGEREAAMLPLSGPVRYWAPKQGFVYTLGVIKNFEPVDPYKNEKRVEVQVDGEFQTRLLWLLGKFA